MVEKSPVIRVQHNGMKRMKLPPFKVQNSSDNFAVKVAILSFLFSLFQALLGRSEGISAMSHLILSLHDLRRLAEILTGEERSAQR